MEVKIKRGESVHYLDIDPKDQDMTVYDLREEYAAKFGLPEERFRFKYEGTDEVLMESDKVLGLNWDRNRPSSGSEADSSDKDAEHLKDKEEQEEEKEKEEPKCDDKGDDKDEEKGQLDSSEEEKSDIRRRAELILQMINKCLTDKDKETEISLDNNFVRNEIITVMRMSREETRLPMVGDRVPRAQTLYLEVEEGYPVFMVTQNDGVKHLSCSEHDTIRLTRQRFASVFEVRPQQLVIMKEGTEDAFEQDDDDATLGSQGIDEGSAFRAHVTGDAEVFTIFGFSLCVKLRVSMDRPIRTLKRTIVDVAPDLKNIKFYLWYNGVRLSEEPRATPRAQCEPMGKRIMGIHFIRVMLDLDPDLDISVDAGPDLRAKRLPPQGVSVKKRRKNSHEPPVPPQFNDSNGSGGKSQKSSEGEHKSVEREKAQPEKSSEEDSEKEERRRSGDSNPGEPGACGGSAQASARPKNAKKRRIRLDVNKRALRYFSLLIECRLCEHIVKPDPNGAEHEAPITLNELLPTTRLHELRERIAAFDKEKKEKWQHQILFKNGTMLEPKDDHKTLRELDLHKAKVLYKEPSIKIYVKIDDERNEEIKLAGKTTTFGKLAALVEAMGVSLSREEIFFCVNVQDSQGNTGKVLCLKNASFSDYNIKSGDTLELLRPFRVRVWHRCFAFDGNFFEHSTTLQLKAWLKEESEIEPEEQVITELNGPPKKMEKGKSLGEVGVNRDVEYELYQKGDLPPRLANPTVGGWVESENGNKPGAWIDSHDPDDDDDDDSPGYAGAAGGEAESESDDEDDENFQP